MKYKLWLKNKKEIHKLGRICIPCMKVTTAEDLETWIPWTEAQFIDVKTGEKTKIKKVIGKLFEV